MTRPCKYELQEFASHRAAVSCLRHMEESSGMGEESPGLAKEASGTEGARTMSCSSMGPWLNGHGASELPDRNIDTAQGQEGAEHCEAASGGPSKTAADAMPTRRHVVFSGEMTKAPHGLGKAKTRQFTLWSDGVLSYRAKKERSVLKPLWQTDFHEVEIELDRVSMRRTNSTEAKARDRLGFSEFTIVLVVEGGQKNNSTRRAWALDPRSKEACEQWEAVLRPMVAHGQRCHSVNAFGTSGGRVAEQGAVAVSATIMAAVDALDSIIGLPWTERSHPRPAVPTAAQQQHTPRYASQYAWNWVHRDRT